MVIFLNVIVIEKKFDQGVETISRVDLIQHCIIIWYPSQIAPNSIEKYFHFPSVEASFSLLVNIHSFSG